VIATIKFHFNLFVKIFVGTELYKTFSHKQILCDILFEILCHKFIVFIFSTLNFVVSISKFYLKVQIHLFYRKHNTHISNNNKLSNYYQYRNAPNFSQYMLVIIIFFVISCPLVLEYYQPNVSEDQYLWKTSMTENVYQTISVKHGFKYQCQAKHD